MKKIIRRIILVVCVAVFAYSAYQIGTTMYDYYKLDHDNEVLLEESVTQKNESDDPLDRIVDFETLQKKNKDVIGWMYIPGTNIDYVLMKGKNNDSYIHTNFAKEYSFGGCLFIDEINNKELTDDNTIFYGHNMKNGSMFAAIRKMNKKEKFEASPKIYVYLPDGSINLYDIYAFTTTKANSQFYVKGIDYKSYINTVLDSAKFKRDVDQENQNPLIMLSTCVEATGDDRYVAFARLDKNIKR